MSRINSPLMLVGSVPLATSEEVLAAASDEIGGLVAALPDGETGYRTNWINYQAYFVHHLHPDIETLQRPAALDGVLQWNPSGFHDLWNFKVKPGVEKVEYGDLFYASAAIQSYVAFRDLRDVGRIPPGARFQVSLPTAPGGILAFFRADGNDYYRVRDSYEEALTREISKVLEVVPPEDLAIQWDVCNEVMDIERAYPWLTGLEESAWERFERAVRVLGAAVPEGVLLGYHLCYGNLGGKHIVEPADLGIVTRMANIAVELSGRRVDWVHMPVPISRTDDAYFAPLADLRVPDAELFLGLIHGHDGVEGARQRFDAARRYVSGNLGAATACGFGRLPADHVRPLLRLHRQVADEVVSGAPSI